MSTCDIMFEAFFKKNLLIKSINCRFYIFMHCKLESMFFDFSTLTFRKRNERNVCLRYCKNHTHKCIKIIYWNGQYCEKHDFNALCFYFVDTLVGIFCDSSPFCLSFIGFSVIKTGNNYLNWFDNILLI